MYKITTLIKSILFTIYSIVFNPFFYSKKKCLNYSNFINLYVKITLYF